MPYISGVCTTVQRFLSVHNCVLMILSAEVSLCTISYFGVQRFLCAIFILWNLECREVSLCTYIFTWGKP